MARSCNCPSHSYLHAKVIMDSSASICSMCKQNPDKDGFLLFQCGEIICIPCYSTKNKMHIMSIYPEQTDNKQTQAK